MNTYSQDRITGLNIAIRSEVIAQIGMVCSSQSTGVEMIDGGEVSVDSGFSYQTIRELISKGHKVGFDYGTYGGYQAIIIDSKIKFIMALPNREKMVRMQSFELFANIPGL